ncbi:hypothetical protein CB172_02270 [Salmonella enterica subsp. enterica serovar Claibornei]|nr:hypothetical protein [Salmonella enterica subsp. enterica serovar Claibornei]
MSITPIDRIWSSTLGLPQVVFRTQHQFNDYVSDDMHCGDMDDEQLLNLGLINISSIIDPYTRRFLEYHSGYHGYNSVGLTYPYEPGREVSHEECVDILFSEMKSKSKWFANSLFTTGYYNNLIIEMIDHFRYGNGTPFYSPSLGAAYKDRMLQEQNGNNPLGQIKKVMSQYINLAPNISTYQHINISTYQHINISTYGNMSLLAAMKKEIMQGKLTKFDSHGDMTNGLSITVHDIYAQEINMLRFQKNRIGWRADFSFKAQDHFGLDITDIKNTKFSMFNFFKIWFFLQRHKDYAFKPFFTNFMAYLTLSENTWR